MRPLRSFLDPARSRYKRPKKRKEIDPDRLWLDDMTQCYLSLEEGQYVGVHDDENLWVTRGPDILLRTSLLKFGDRTDEGVLVKSATMPWFEIVKQLRRNPTFRFQFTGASRKFEEFLAGSYRQWGWDEVILTPRSADRGRDVIASKTGMNPRRVLEQAKAYSPRRRVKHDEVRAMICTLYLDPRATECGITTTSDFAPTIRSGSEFREVIPSVLKLMNGREFVDHVTVALSLG
jgi:hypothetical protein